MYLKIRITTFKLRKTKVWFGRNYIVCFNPSSVFTSVFFTGAGLQASYDPIVFSTTRQW